MRNWLANLLFRAGRWLISFGNDLARYPSALNMPASEYRKYLKERYEFTTAGARDLKPGLVIGPEDPKFPDTVQGREASIRARALTYLHPQNKKTG